MADTVIEWSDKVWNPVVGCMKVSDGCTNCYAIKTAYRLEHGFKQAAYQGITRKLPDGSKNWTGLVRCLPERLEIPLKWKKPQRIFVNSMSDLFHEDVPFDFIAKVWNTMWLAPQHKYQILTKRPERMLEFTKAWYSEHSPYPNRHQDFFSHVWLGVSTEDQKTADERIPFLLQTPAKVRWLSCEPLLGPIDLAKVDLSQTQCEDRIDWVVAGGESGSKRVMDLDWARSLRDQCQVAGIPYLFKQVGGATHAAGGRLLDGRTWDEYPE